MFKEEERKLEAIEMWIWRKMKRTRNEEELKLIQEKKTNIEKIQKRKRNCGKLQERGR